MPSMMDEIIAELNEVRVVTPPPEPPITLTLLLDMFRGNPVYTRRLTPHALLTLFIRSRLNRADRELEGHTSSSLTAQAELALRMLEAMGITRPDDTFMAHEAYARIHALHSDVPEMCQALTDIGVDFTRRLREIVCSIACSAARDNRWQVLEHLASHHQPLLASQRSRPFPLFIAAHSGHLESVSALILHGFELHKDALATLCKDPIYQAIESTRRRGASTEQFSELALRRHRAITLCETKKRFF